MDNQSYKNDIEQSNDIIEDFKYRIGAQVVFWIDKLPFKISRKSHFRRSIRCVQSCARCLCIPFDSQTSSKKGIAELVLKMFLVLVAMLFILDSIAQNRRFHSMIRNLEKSDSVPAQMLERLEIEFQHFYGAESKVCELLKQSTMQHKHVTIVRLMGPSLPPLQSPEQQSNNLQHILKNEKELQRSSHCIRQIWVITCMYNSTEEQLIRKTLDHHNQAYYKVPGCADKPEELLEQLKDVNKARNFGIAIALDQTTDWVLPLDGNVFLPGEALEKIVHGVIVDDWLGHLIHVIPLFRALRCQRIVFDDYFQIDDEFQNSFVNVREKYPVITDNLSRKQEGQLAISAKHPEARTFFDSNEKYSKRSKMGLIERLNDDPEYQKLRCGGFVGLEWKNAAMSQMLHDVHTCGYSIRLLYWPKEDNCPFDQMPRLPELAMDKKELSDHSINLNKRTEVSSNRRYKMRKRSVKKLKEAVTQ